MELSLLCFLCLFSPVFALIPRGFGFEFSDSLILPRANNPTSQDGNCGSNSDTNATCLTSSFGNCCSEKGFCGKTSAYCNEGCQDAFGKWEALSETAALQKVTVVITQHIVVTDLNRCQSEFGDCSSDESTKSTTTTLPTTTAIDESTSSEPASSTDVDSTSTSIPASSSTDVDESESSSTSSSTTSLTTGAKAGIAVGAVVGGLGLIGLVTWLVLRKKNKKPAAPVENKEEVKPHNPATYEMYAETPTELHGETRYELPANYDK
ncbi:hypothetical protein FLONG3_6630 [Fusarium longipes]|uniref:Chitin-binding type-1 domain-containing protein n=1 Tax=Fusarium longipes TaxID=694270 RepID=A0A395SKK4_9HYPO|nr:hypothetical protein FLONG3_6630 [Fusarium longipes]